MKKLILTTTLIAGMAVITACSSGSSSETTAKVEASAESKAEEVKVEAKAGEGDVQELEGTISEIKNVLFDVTDANDTTYSFTFDGEAPKGLDTVKEGDKVKVTFKGELSEVDPITDVVSVEKLN